MEKYFLELNHLRKTYPNGFQAIFDLSLQVKQGEFVVLVGPSGCGKTTTIRMIAGLENVSSGEIKIDGRIATNLLARKRDISMVFQNYALFPHLSVKDNIAFTLKTRHAPREKIAKKVRWTAQVLKLDYLLHRKPMQLSGGQRQRVALGRAMAAEPKLFLMDEPLSNLDAKLRGVMRTTIRKLHNELQTTSIYVTHDQVEAMTMADKIVVMSDGFIQQVGSPEDIFENPVNIFVASFIGAPEINLITGEYKQGKLQTELGTIVTKRKIIRKNKSNQMTLAFRPKYAKMFVTKRPNTLKCQVQHVEVLGAESIVYLIEKMRIVVPTANKPKTGQTVYLLPDPTKVSLFDPTSKLSLTSKVNQETQTALDVYMQSQKLISRRTQLLEKEKNKKIGQGWVDQASGVIERKIYPSHIILNPRYSTIQRQIRDAKNAIKDARRRQNKQEIIKNQDAIKKLKLELKAFVSAMRKHTKLISEFERSVKKIQNMIANITDKKYRPYFQAITKFNNEAIAIKKAFNETLEYDYPELKQYVTAVQNYFKAGRSGKNRA